MGGKGKIFLCVALLLLSTVAGGAGGFLAAKAGLLSENTQPVRQSESTTHKSPTGIQSNKQTTVADIAQMCMKTVVNIDVETVVSGYTGGSAFSKTEKSHGTGVVVRENGYIVTCYHVVEGADKITVVMDDKTEYSAELVGYDKSFDMAVIHVDATDLEAAVSGDSATMRAGEGIVIIGNPLGEFGSSVSAGVLSAKEREVTIQGEPLRLLQTDAAVNPGNSGGGMFDMQGRLIGMVNAKMSAAGIEGLAFAIPLNTIQKKIDSIISEGNTGGKAVLGVATKNAECYVDGVKYNCVTVTSVREGSAAEQAGLLVGDYILRAGDKPITNNDDLVLLIKYSAPGDELELEVYRDNEKITVKTILSQSA